MSKPMAVTLPVVLLILDYYPLERVFGNNGSRDIGRVLVEKIPYFLLSAGISAATIMTNVSRGSLMGLETHDLMTRFKVAASGYALYLKKMFIPFDLVPYYPYPRDITLLTPQVAASITVVTLLTVLSIYFIKKQKAFSAVWSYYIVSLLPVIGIVQLGSYAAANRYSYLPMLGPLLLVGLLAGSVFKKTGRRGIQALVLVVIIVVSGLLAGRTMADIKNWKDTITLWSYQINLHPGRVPIAYTNRGIAYDKAGDVERAIADYSMSIKIDPKYVKAYNNRGVAYAGIKKYKEAIEDYNRSIEIDPTLAQAYNNRAVAYGMQGDFERAVEDCSRAIEITPAIPDIYFNRGLAYSELKRPEEAVKDYSKAIMLNPWHLKAYNNRAGAYKDLGRFDLAVSDYSRSMEISPGHVESYFNRGNVHMRTEDYRSAIRDYSSVVELDPLFAQAYNNRGNAYNRLNEMEPALSDYNRVIDIEPKNASVYFNRALLYIKLDEKRKAYNDLEKASSLGLKRADEQLKRFSVKKAQ